MINLVIMGDCTKRMGIFMKGNGKEVNLMDMENIYIMEMMFRKYPLI
jgi:hypothetical protein